MPSRWIDDNSFHIRPEYELLIKWSVKEKYEIVIRMVFNQSFADLVGVPAKPFHLSWKQETGIDADAQVRSRNLECN